MGERRAHAGLRKRACGPDLVGAAEKARRGLRVPERERSAAGADQRVEVLGLVARTFMLRASASVGLSAHPPTDDLSVSLRGNTCEDCADHMLESPPRYARDRTDLLP